MPEFLTTNGHTQVLIPLRIRPYHHKEMPTITGNAFSDEAGAVLYGHYNMEYLLPGNDRIRLIANHDKKTVQLMLFTHDPELLKLLPGSKSSSLVVEVINKIQRYRIQASSYKQPLNPIQEEKLKLANQCIKALNLLLEEERQLDCKDHYGHEELRKKILALIASASNGNRLLADNPLVSEGTLGSLLFDAHKIAQHYQFNTFYPVSQQDQMDFSQTKSNNPEDPPCFIWDSEIHIGHEDLNDTLRVICHHYGLTAIAELNEIPANRFIKLDAFFRKLWRDGRDWFNYLTIESKPGHKTEVINRSDGLSITQITPYYTLKGLKQEGYPTLNELLFQLTESRIKPRSANSLEEATKILQQLPDSHWVLLEKQQSIIIRLENRLVTLHYFIKDNLFYPAPDGHDLYILSQTSKNHLYLPERASLRVQAFFSNVPVFFKNFIGVLHHYCAHDLYDEFYNHIHAAHQQEAINPITESAVNTIKKVRQSLYNTLKNNGLLANGQTLEEFIKEQINNSPYVIARANHPPIAHTYDNPLHRTINVIRHVAGFFIDTNARNPITGAWAMAAYAYGASAVLAPKQLTEVLQKLHLESLIAGIEPTQRFAHWMNHGLKSEAISAAATFWQVMISAGNLDKFFIKAIQILKEDPAEVAIIAALALNLGYGITKIIPPLEQEMGDFPYTTYAALGGKSGAAVYDIIMHPGDDWFLGTFKWFFKHLINLGKLFIAPFFEAYYYGYDEGFVPGLGRSAALALQLSIEIFAAVMDLILILLTVPLLELSTLLIYTPFRGIINAARKTLALIGNISVIGQLLIDLANRPTYNNFITDFRRSPLYGFNNPLGHFSESFIINLVINTVRLLLLPLMQLVKNALLLPIIDLVSLSLRILLSILNPGSRIIAYTLGSLLYAVGSVWDNSIGLLFSTSATLLTLMSNWLENSVVEGKQSLLSAIEVLRANLYDWSVMEALHHAPAVLEDQEYYHNDPRRLELVPHADKDCLLQQLLDKKQLGNQTGLQGTAHSFFHHKQPVVSSPELSFNNKNQTI